jgi:hypothetical protein
VVRDRDNVLSGLDVGARQADELLRTTLLAN